MRNVALEILTITMKQDKHLMYFTQIVDVFPAMDGPTPASIQNKMLTGREIVLAEVGPITIRSLS